MKGFTMSFRIGRKAALHTYPLPKQLTGGSAGALGIFSTTYTPGVDSAVSSPLPTPIVTSPSIAVPTGGTAIITVGAQFNAPIAGPATISAQIWIDGVPSIDPAVAISLIPSQLSPFERTFQVTFPGGGSHTFALAAGSSSPGATQHASFISIVILI